MTEIQLNRNSTTGEVLLTNVGKDQLNVQNFDPSDLLAGALAKCTESTVRNFANKKNYEMSNVGVRVDFARDMETKTSSFMVHLDITGDLSDNELNKLHKSAEKSFVRRVLSQPIVLDGHVHYNGKKRVL